MFQEKIKILKIKTKKLFFKIWSGNPSENETTNTDWRSIYIVTFVSLISSIQGYSIIPTLWPYIKFVSFPMAVKSCCKQLKSQKQFYYLLNFIFRLLLTSKSIYMNASKHRTQTVINLNYFQLVYCRRCGGTSSIFRGGLGSQKNVCRF